MEFDKTERARSLFKELVAQFVREEANTDPLITITDAMVSPGGRHVNILFTTIPDGKEEDALIFLKRKGSDLRSYIKKHGRFKHIPHLEFQVDYGERHRQHIDEVVRRIEGGNK